MSFYSLLIFFWSIWFQQFTFPLPYETISTQTMIAKKHEKSVTFMPPQPTDIQIKQRQLPTIKLICLVLGKSHLQNRTNWHTLPYNTISSILMHLKQLLLLIFSMFFMLPHINGRIPRKTKWFIVWIRSNLSRISFFSLFFTHL